MYERAAGAWTETLRLRSPLPRTDALFGRSVALSPDRLAVGADADDGRAPGSGAVYVFVR